MASEVGVRNLVKKAKSGGDPEAFGQLYDEYVSQIFRYVYYKVGNYADAQDLTGQTFLRAFENIQSYELRDVAFSSWLYRIAHNLVVDFFRKESKRNDVPIEGHSLGMSETGNPADELMASHESQQLYNALSRLTNNQREVIVLKFIDNLSNWQVAEIMGISVGAVKSAQKRALIALNRILGSSNGSGPSSF